MINTSTWMESKTVVNFITVKYSLHSSNKTILTIHCSRLTATYLFQ